MHCELSRDLQRVVALAAAHNEAMCFFKCETGLRQKLGFRQKLEMRQKHSKMMDVTCHHSIDKLPVHSDFQAVDNVTKQGRFKRLQSILCDEK